jgi:hypothetical protein
MAIVQISKIQHRTGANTDLPQLDIGEIGFSTDTQQVFIGNDPVLVPIDSNVSLTTQTEILTEVSLLNQRVANGPGSTKVFAPLAGAGNTVFNIQNIRTGQLIVGDGDGVAANTLVNWTGNRLGNGANVTTNKLKLGGVANIVITGGTSGSVLSTDGNGVLSWASMATGGGGTVATQTGHNGKFLTTDGSNTSWSNVFADANFATTVKNTISVTDSGGDGSLTYSNVTGVITYTGPSNTEVRAHFSAGTGVTYAANGRISIGQDVANTANVEFDGITGSNLTLNSLAANAVLYASASGNLVSSESDFTYNTTTNTLTVGRLEVGTTANIGTLFKAPMQTKANNDPGDIGQMCWDADYIYVCTSGSTWKRVALSTF